MSCYYELLSFYFRLLRYLKRKDPTQIKLEQLEQGFSLYMNGANSELRKYCKKIHSFGHLKNETQTTTTNGELHRDSILELFRIFTHQSCNLIIEITSQAVW